jgi:hypothetical protein
MKINREDSLLGETVKIITPLELSNGGKLRYIDLGLMLTKKGNEIETKDVGTINDLVEKNIISSSFKDKIYKIYETCKKKMEDGEEQVIILSE